MLDDVFELAKPATLVGMNEHRLFRMGHCPSPSSRGGQSAVEPGGIDTIQRFTAILFRSYEKLVSIPPCSK